MTGAGLNLHERAALFLKAFSMRFPARSSRASGSLLLPNTTFDYARAVGDGRGSSVVMAVALWLARTFPEAPARVQRLNENGTPRILPAHPFQTLLTNPNPHYSDIILWMASLVDLVLDGNFYWIKLRNALGEPVQLWYVPCHLIEPKWPDRNDDGRTYIEYYDYKPFRGQDGIHLLPEDIVHVRYGIDPQNTRKGLSPLGSLMREIFTDDEAANFSAAILRNLGIPGVIISPSDPDQEVGADDLEEVKQTFMRRFVGDRRGEPMVLRTATDVKVLSFSPQELELRALRRLPEERVTAVLGVPAIVVGLGAGLERSTFANFAEAREAAYESNIAPLQRLVASELTRNLLAEFTVDPSFQVMFDTRNVRILQDDINKRSKRMTEEFEGGLRTRAEARAVLGEQFTDADNVYRIPKTMIEFDAATNATSLTQDILGAGNQFGDTPAPKKNGGKSAEPV